MKRRGTNELDQLKPWSLKIQEATSKSVTGTEKIGKQYVRHIIYTNQGHLHTKFISIIDFTDEPAIRCDVSDVENAFVDDCK